MEANKEKNNRSPLNRHIKKSSFITEIENDRNLRIAQLQQSRKQLSYSTFLDLHEVHIPITPTPPHMPRKDRELSPRNQELLRARSLKTIADHKPIIQTAEKTTNDLTENMIRLKLQEMTFKYKTKIACLLKEINISANEMAKFNTINKTEQIISFLSLRVRERLVKSQISQENFIKARSKSKEVYKDHQAERQMLKKKLQEKENIQKEVKSKLRDTQIEARELLNKISQKEKELSLRMDELYQQKMTISEQQKLISRLQQTCDSLQKHNKDSISQLNTESKDLFTVNKELEQQNDELAAIMQQFKDEIQQYKQKQNKLLEINKQLNQEVIRWRQRYEDGPSTVHQKEQSESNQGQPNVPLTPSIPSMKKSTLSMSNYGFAQNQLGNSRRFSSTPAEIDNMRLLIKVQELQKKNKQLSRDIMNYATIKQRYQQNLAAVSEENCDLSKGFDTNKIQVYKQSSASQYKVELEAHYKKKIEDIVKGWKDKLYEIVHKYQDQLQTVKEQVDKLQTQKQELQRKILALANDKYIVQSKLIQKERQIYEMSKVISTNSIFYQPKSAKQDYSHSLVVSQQEIKPALSQVTEVLNESPEGRREEFQSQHFISGEINDSYSG